MKRKIAMVLSMLLVATAIVPVGLTASAANAAPKVLPAIREWTGGAGSFTPNASTVLVNASGVDKQVELVQGFFKDMLGMDLAVKTTGSSNVIVFTLDTSLQSQVGSEGYTLNATTSKIEIKAPTATGLLYGGITVVQSVYADGYFPCGSAKDYPEYEVRSGMLDVARAYVPMAELKEISRYMAWFKMNEIHLHINDDAPNGHTPFRLESDIPGLTAKDGYYTKDEYRAYQREMLDYGVKIITEIDTPYHASCFTQITDPAYKVKYLDGSVYGSWYTNRALDLSDPQTVNTVKTLFNEMLGGDDPVIISDTVHIGMDEYSRQLTDQIVNYCNELIALVNSHGYKARFWSGAGADGCMKGGTYTGDYEVNFWDYNHSGATETVSMGCDFVNTTNSSLYIVPGDNGYPDSLDLERIYTQWQVYDYGFWNNSQLCDPDDEHLKGACFAVWNDIHTAYFGLTYRDVLDRVREMTALIAEKTWCGGDTVSKITVEDFMSRYNIQSVRAGDSDPYNTSLPDEGINLNFDSSTAPSYAKYNGTVSGGEFVLDGNSYISLTPSAVGWPNSLSFDITLSEYPSEQTALFAGYETTGSEIFIDKNGVIGFKSKISETDHYSFTFGYRVPLNKKVSLCLTSDAENTRLIVNGHTAYDTINDHASLIPYETDAILIGKRYSAMVIPLEKIGSGLKGSIDNISVSETAKSLDGLSMGENLALGKTVTVSGTEVADSLGPENAVDGDTSTRLSFARDKDEQWMVVDLGATHSVKCIEISFFERISSYAVLLSTDGTNYTQVYEVSGLTDGIAANEVITLETAVNARYVKYLQRDRFSTAWGEYSGGINEFRVFAFNSGDYDYLVEFAKNTANALPDSDPDKKKIMTAAYTLETYIKSDTVLSTTLDLFRDELYYSTDAAANEKIGIENNVALGKTYVTTQLYRQGGADVSWEWDETAPEAYPDENNFTTLTDGVIGKGTPYGNGAWAGFHYKTPQYISDGYNFITVDLEDNYNLTQLQLYVGTKALGADASFAAPETIEFFVSDDGKTFTSVGSAVYSDSTTETEVAATLNCNTTARYIQARFTGNSWMFVSEIAAVGTKVMGEDHECTAQGEIQKNDTHHWYECECGKKVGEEKHEAGNWTVKTPATTEKAGEKIKSCVDCGYEIESAEIPKLTPDHSHEAVGGWVSDKDNHWKECACGQDLEIGSHTPGEWTDSEQGGQVQLCTVCGYEMGARDVEDGYVLGDVNRSGAIDMMDYILLKRNYFGTFKFDADQLKRGDVNHSDAIDMMDYILLKRAYFGTFTLA